MSGYSKLRLASKKSRSIDFSDLLISNTFPIDQTTRTHKNTSPTSPNRGRKSTAREEINTIHEHDHDQYQADDSSAIRKSTDTNVGAIHLSKNSSVSAATSSHRFRLERQRSATSSSTPKGGIKSAVKRAFSIRRSSSSSVSHEKYCRIHDQCVAILLENTFDDEDYDDVTVDETKEHNIPTTKTMRSTEEEYGSRGKILRACKRLLGFH